jgi:elongation factor P
MKTIVFIVLRFFFRIFVFYILYWFRSLVVRQSSAKAPTSVRFRPEPHFFCKHHNTTMGTTADLRNGAVIKYNNELCVILESEHRTPGNLRAFYQVKMRNLKTGKLLENRYRSGESIEFVRVEKKNYQYLYAEGDVLYFMDNETYDQVPVSKTIVGDAAKFMKENQEVQIAFNDTEVVTVDLPEHVILRITQTDPGLKGNTATNALKPAIVETGATVMVPLFVNENDVIRIDTRSAAYMERVKE